MDSWLVVGLGNPGPRYERTRHNAGFLFLDRLAAVWGSTFHETHSGLWLEASFGSGRLVKPLTWMNNSGAVFAGLDYQPSPGLKVLVAVDTMDLPPGSLRLKKKGGTAGHNGLKSVCAAIGQDFYPLYIGVGRPGEGETVIEHVLGDFGPAMGDVDRALDHAVITFPVLLEKGIDQAMNLINSFGHDSRED